jgi:methylenetetrahydrofolate dehydrogenase (NADP+)/methenyltetrahydrofolate cyclohydrolase
VKGAVIIDGRALAAALRQRVAAAAARLKEGAGIVPGLATILVGDDPASLSYVRSKARAAVEAGLACFEQHLPADTAEPALVAEVRRLVADERVDAILVQLPLPPQIDADRVIAAIDPAKDVDGFHPLNVGRLWRGRPGLVPCTPQACLRLIRTVRADLAGAEAVVIGRSNIVGKPAAALLLAAGCTVTLVHSQSRDKAAICRRADILVAAAGRARLVTQEWIKPGAIVIDVGINPVIGMDGKRHIVGDVDYAAARAVAGAITPVPGGVGPMTIACVLGNTLLAACRRRGIAEPAL